MTSSFPVADSGTARVAVVIPAYQEAATIRAVALGALRQVHTVIVVDDGSQDGTSEAIADLDLILLRNETNQGKAASLWRGMSAARTQGADVIITLDADGQHRPEDIPRFLAATLACPGMIVIGSRLHERQAFPVSRYRANRFANFWISWAAGHAIEDSQSGFRLYPVRVLDVLRLPVDRRHGFVFESEILIVAGRQGIRSVALPIRAIYAPGARPSHFRPVLDIARIVRMVAWKLVSRGFYPQGLFRSLRHSPLRVPDLEASDVGAATSAVPPGCP
jgi:glycosyltransferase involved in cell wall biosynthesis